MHITYKILNINTIIINYAVSYRYDTYYLNEMFNKSKDLYRGVKAFTKLNI
jgi:hypothetical protein